MTDRSRKRQSLRFLADPLFWAAIAAGAATVRALLPWIPAAAGRPDVPALLSFILLQPLVEEWVFRGQLQPWLRRHLQAGASAGLISPSNLATSALFSCAHLLTHSVAWSAAVMLPSLVFGWFRERHGHIGPGLALHAIYNACYLTSAHLIAADEFSMALLVR